MICKLKISAKRLRKRIWRIITDIFAVGGVLVMVAEAASEVFKYQGLFDFYRSYVWWIAAAVIIGCIYKNWDRLEFKVKITDSPDITITLKVCDVLNNEGAVVIPTNSTFDTIMTDEFISEGSIQGQYQIKWFKNRTLELDKKLDEGLAGKSFIELKDGRKHKKKRYQIGTVSRVSEKGKRAYFLVDSDIDPQGHPIDVDATDVSQALNNLWYDLSRNGNCEPYSIPLIGTGKARAKDVSRNEVVQQIILSFLAASKEHKITENLTVCIHPGDYEKIDWDGLCEFLKYQSQYANVKPVETKPIGTAETTPTIITYEGENDIEENDEPKSDSVNEQNVILSERDQMLVTLLTGNNLSRTEVAEVMGLSMASTNRLLTKLQNAGVIMSEGSARQRRYYVPVSPNSRDNGVRQYAQLRD